MRPWTGVDDPVTLANMTQDHQPVVPIALEQLVAGLAELELVLGDDGKRLVPLIRERLIEAMAARDRGDSAAMVASVGRAMKELAAVGDRLGSDEGQLMTMLAQRFEGALLRGDLSEAKRDMDVMFDRSGARYRRDDE